MGSISMPQGRGNRQHNLRNYGEGKLPSNVNASRTEQNIVWKDETTSHAYHRFLMMQVVSIMQNRNVRIVR